MRFERLVIEAGETTFSLDFHPQLTVISGVGVLEREGLVSELIGSMSASRAGVHAEIVGDNGNRFAVFRPQGARHRVVDVDSAIDVSDRFADSTGAIDLLAAVGLDTRTARRALRMTAGDLSTDSNQDETIQHLAAIRPGLLWNAADQLLFARDHLDAEAKSVGTNAEDAEAVAQVDQLHAKFETAQATAEKSRKLSFLGGTLAALAAVPTAMVFSTVAAMGWVIGAAVITALSFFMNQRMTRARNAEQDALAKAGASSYLGFHLQRVDGMLDQDTSRERMVRANANYRRALDEWSNIAGAVEVDWAIEHRDEVQATAAMHENLRSVVDGGGSHEVVGGEMTALAHALISRLDAVRKAGPVAESLPLILDNTFTDLDFESKSAMLELLTTRSVGQQVIMLTDDDDVAGWARLEAMTGTVMVIEPSAQDPEPSETTARIAVA